MPNDIRSFFGGGGGPKAASGSSKPEKPPKTSEKKSRGRKVVPDDDEDEEVLKPKKATTPKKKKAAPESKEEETTSSAYFASKPKASTSKSTPIRSKSTATTNGATSTPSKATNGATPSTGRRSARKTSKKSYAEDDEDDTKGLLEDETGGNDDIFADGFKSRKADDDYDEGSDDEVIKPAARPKANGVKKKQDSDDDDDDVEMSEIPAFDGGGDGKRKRAAPSKATSKKRKSEELDEDDEDDFLDDDDDAPKKKSRKTTTKAAPKKPKTPAKKEVKENSKEIQAIYNSITTIRAPTPPPRDAETRKFNYQYGGGNTDKAPLAAGSKSVPEGADNCLVGLTFVFTGVLDSLGREEGQNLVKRYGGKVTTGPSKKTSYVVLGQDAGPKKLETIHGLGLKTINEDGLFQLISKLPPGGGDSKAADDWAAKQEKAEAKIKKDAEEMERLEKEKEREAAKEAKAKAARTGNAPPPKPKGPRVEDRLWVDKYAPDSLGTVCGNKGLVEKLQTWLRNWRKNAKTGFKKGGADGIGTMRAAMLHGPPGIGKTTAAHLVAKLEGYDVVETNASDTRSKKLMEQTLKGVLDTTSLLGYFAGDGKRVDEGKRNLVLIMDEVDGMSAGDRGGVGALAAVAKKTNVPMILICNERRQPKMKPFDFAVADFAFRRPTTDQIQSRIATIAYREGLNLPTNVMQAIIEGGNADIRQIINMVSTIKIDNKDIDYADGRAMGKAWEKHVILKPWDIVTKIMRPQMFAASSSATLNEKTELYFNDHEFSYLMLQENYLKGTPSLLGDLGGRKRNLKFLELAEKASSSISDGDLVDRMIHGSQQQWSLMPLHAIFSFVKPASYVYGNFNHQVGFAAWLGQNSKTGKLSRYIKEIQGHMRLRTSADRNEIRQQYLPALWDQTVGKMINTGKEAVPEIIDFMDSYYLTKEDYDAIMELGVGPMNMEEDKDKQNKNDPGVKKIDTQTKAAFTRMYNAQNHPMPFVKATAMVGAKNTGPAVKKEKPDLEEAIEDSEGEAEIEVKDDDEEDMDISKDKYIKAPKKKAGGAAKGGAEGGAKKRKGKADEEDKESEEGKPKKKGGGRKGKGKA